MNFKNVILTSVLSISSFSLFAQISTPGGSGNATANSSTPSTSVGINTHLNQNKGTLHVGKKLSIDADGWADVSLQYNMYNDNGTRKIIHSNSHVSNGGLGRLSFHEYGFSFLGDLTRGNNNTVVPAQPEIMRINYNGNVGINIAKAKAKLHVNGTSLIGGGTFTQNKTNAAGKAYSLYVKGGIISEEVKVELADGNWADYVFAEDYTLKSLEEVEATIQEKGHLHNIDSAEKLEKEGLELKSITINQQEKIEELFLHMIEMNKRMKTLEEENAKLREQVQKYSK